MNKSTKVLWCLVIALGVTGFAAWTAPKQKLQPAGILLPLHPSKPALPADQVMLYSDAAPPNRYQTLGSVDVLLHLNGADGDNQNLIQKAAREIAAKAGANGIIVRVFGHTIPGQVPSALAIYNFQGIAIRTSTP